MFAVGKLNCRRFAAGSRVSPFYVGKARISKWPRPSDPHPPYHDWVQEHIAPITWQCAVTHLGRQLDKLRPPRHPPKIDPSPGSDSIAEDDFAPIPAPPYQPLKCDQASQITPPRKLIHDQSCQVGCPIMADKGIGPDFIRLEVSIVPRRAVNFYHPLGRWFGLTRSINPGRFAIRCGPCLPHPEIEVLADQFPPEATREVEGPPLLYGFPPEFLAAVNRAGRAFRPPPPMFPTEPRRSPPDVDPHYVPAPPGIRAVCTAQAALFRSQPEMNHPTRRILPLAPHV